MESLARLVSSCHLDRYDEAARRLYVQLHGGPSAYLNLPDGSRHFAASAHFHVSLVGSLGPEGRGPLDSFVAKLCAVEQAMPAGMTPSLLFLLVRIAIERRVPAHAVARVASALSTWRERPAPSVFDVQFYALFEADRSFADFMDSRAAIKRETLCDRLDPEVLAAPHVLLFGIARSGTRWAFEMMQAVLEESDDERFVVVDGITDPWSKPVNFASPIQRPKATPGVATPNHFYDDVRRTNLYFDPNVEREGLDACMRSLPHALQLMVPKGARMVAKAHADQTLTLLIEALKRHFPNMRFISMLRDPRNVLISQRHFFKRPSEKPIESELKELLVRAITFERRVAALGGLTLRYEAMLADPEGAVRRVAAFLGKVLDDEAVGRVAHRCAFETMSGGQAYGQIRDGAHFRGGSRWDRELSDDEKERVARVCESEIVALGYEV